MKLHKIVLITIGIILSTIILVALRNMSQDAQVPHKENRATERFRKANKVLWKDTIEEQINFTARYGKDSNQRIVRKGILMRRPNARAVVLICHGYMCNKDDVRFLRTMFQDYTTLTFDFRAHGECIQGQHCTLGSREKYDVIGAVDFIKSQPDLKNKPLIVYGFSMGAVASILAQAEAGNLFDAAIWDCPFDSTDNILSRSIDRLKITIGGYEFNLPGRSFLKKYAYNTYVQEILKAALKTIAKMDACAINTCVEPVDTVNAAKKICIPTLMVTCKNDTKAPVDAVTAVYNSMSCGYKRLWLTDGRFHYDSYFYNPERYTHRVKKFIERFLDGSLKQQPQAGIWDDSPEDGGKPVAEGAD